MRQTALLRRPAAVAAPATAGSERLPPGACALFVLAASAGLWALVIAVLRALL